jgi:hypothetical protein
MSSIVPRPMVGFIPFPRLGHSVKPGGTWGSPSKLHIQREIGRYEARTRAVVQAPGILRAGG